MWGLPDLALQADDEDEDARSYTSVDSFTRAPSYTS